MERQFYSKPSTKQHRREMRNNPTRGEAAMWHGLRSRRAGGYLFLRQHGIGPFIVDFFCRECKLAVEVDGATHDDPEQKEYDARRTEFLNAHGIQVVRFTDGEVLWSVDMCVEKILAKIAEIEAGRSNG